VESHNLWTRGSGKNLQGKWVRRFGWKSRELCGLRAEMGSFGKNGMGSLRPGVAAFGVEQVMLIEV